MSLDDDVRAELDGLEAAHRLRVPRVVDSPQGPRVTLDGIDVLNFASNDYLSLAGDRRLVNAAVAAVEESGVGAGASRLIVGNHRHHDALEREIADWLCVDGVRLFNSGYVANVGVITTLCREGDAVFSDELNHASIIDGCRLSRASVRVFPHRDLAALERMLASAPPSSLASGSSLPAGSSPRFRRVIISETLFSMDGDLADVAALVALAKRHDAVLVLDEAHALGVLGPEGRGAAAAVGVVPDVLIGTCGKALGAFGAFAATSRAVSDLLWTRARSLVFSTGLPPMVSASVRAAIEIVRGTDGDARRRSLSSRVQLLRSLVPELGGSAESPIAPLVVGDDRRVMEISGGMLERRVFVQGIRPPTVPEGTARLRVSVSAGHTEEDIRLLAAQLRFT